MSLIKRRKSPGWATTTVSKQTYRFKTVKIVNPISRKKINLNGPTHKRLIQEKVLDENGLDIRKIKTKKDDILVKKSKDDFENDIIIFYTVGHRWNWYYIFSGGYVAIFRLHHNDKVTWDIIKKFSGKEIWKSINIKFGKKVITPSTFTFLEEILIKKVPKIHINDTTGIDYHGVEFHKYEIKQLELLKDQYRNQKLSVFY